MTTEAAISLLSEVAAELGVLANADQEFHPGNHPHDETLAERWPSAVKAWLNRAIGSLGGALLASEPFVPLRDSWSRDGDGGDRFIRSRVGHWAAMRVLAGWPPAAIVAEAGRQIAENIAREGEFSPVWGCAVKRTVKLKDGVFLLPRGDFLLLLSEQGFGKNSVLSDCMAYECCILLQEIETRRSYLSQNILGKSVTMPAAADLEKTRAVVRAAILLSSKSPVEMPMVSRVAMNLLSNEEVQGKGSIVPTNYIFPESIMVNEDSIERNFAALSKFEDADPILLACDRLGRARANLKQADIAVDLGIALEIALLRGDANANSDISFRLASRAAWLLGGNEAARCQIFEQARSLCDAHRKALQQGRLEQSDAFNPVASEDLVRSVIEAIVLNGEFPCWPESTPSDIECTGA